MGAGCGKKGITMPLKISVWVIGIFSIVETVGGFLSGSLALLGDAGHMWSDTLALGVSLFAAYVAMRPPSKSHTYGFGRAEVLSAWFSSLFLFFISLAVIYEAVIRLKTPPTFINAPMVIWLALVGLIVNLIVAYILHSDTNNLNMRAAFLHVMSDLLASIVALISGIVILYTNWKPIDSILSIVIGIMIMISSVRVLRESGLILMEGVPVHISFSMVKESMEKIESVIGIEDLHIWTLNTGKVAMSAHVIISNLAGWDGVLNSLKNMLLNEYVIDHVTLQPETSETGCSHC